MDSIEITISISIPPSAAEQERGPGAPRGEERNRGGAGKGTTAGASRARASATSHVNIRLCVRYGGVRPVCMETKALPSWTTGVEPLVERPCLPTPWWTTRRNTLLLISPSPSLPFLRLPLFHSRSFSARLRAIPIPTPERRSSFSHPPRIVQITPKYHRRIIGGFIDTGRTGRSDLGAVRLIGVNDHGAVSPIVELNGKADSLASRAPFG